MRVITFDKGSKRRMRQDSMETGGNREHDPARDFYPDNCWIRFVLELTHYSFESDTPHLQDRR